ncbi:MAG: hypothetical protein AB7I27_12610 [Bacteriovoracaceae bacterium]
MKFLFLFLVLASFNTFADTYTSINFGDQNGPLGFPKARSVSDAKLLFYGLNSNNQGVGLISTSGKTFEISSSRSYFNIIMHKKDNQVKEVISTSTMDDSGVRFGRGDVTFSGEAAKFIFNALNVKAEVVGEVGIKKSANLICTQGLVQTTCKFKDVAFRDLRKN